MSRVAFFSGVLFFFSCVALWCFRLVACVEEDGTDGSVDAVYCLLEIVRCVI